jgi:transcriptional regulator with XRE-family HTH domain
MTPGERVLKYRTQKGWSQSKLADVSKVPQPTISDLEHNLIPRPAAETIRRLARALDVTMNQLWEGEEYEGPKPAVDEQPASIPVNGDNTLAVEVSC